ncbi:ubiquinol-cytochrome c reductase iron-sulfur subunit [Kutzneria sp. NPDC051319]|uniref:cytochrome bc1 complex Rieske iron-sulfur subunit n=1 Tax=Kutzneria sp. NPDC051319 TaxID=3155047 RepID=UPI00343A3A36
MADKRESASGLTRAELVHKGLADDSVRLTRYLDRWPVFGTRAERRARRHTLSFLGLAVLFGLGFLVVYIGWPWRYVPPEHTGADGYSWYTPLLGVCGGGCLLSLAIGLFLYAKKFLPEEEAVQQRHDEPSPEFGRAKTSAMLTDAAQRSGVPRRRLMLGFAGAGVALPALGAVAVAVGGLIRNPWGEPKARDTLWHTGWHSPNGETVFLRQNTGDPHDVVLVRPGDLDSGAILTVFPFRESERGDPDALSEALTRADNPAQLIKLRPGQHVTPRPGLADYHFGELYAYSKICTHLGCPVSLFEQQTDRLLCPCHQSQFDVLRSAVPVFGPAVRPLPQLPIAVDEGTGYLIARGDFSGAVGPGFWELGS